MCTLLILYRPKNKWPLIIAGNRDEMKDRPWLPPGKHWGKCDGIIAGKDLTAGGSWLGINTNGLVATILNRTNSLGPDIEKNSSELAQFKLTINKKYEEYFSLISTQIDHDQNWSDAAISIDKLYFIEKLLQKINNALN